MKKEQEEQLCRQVADIHRGMYGDAANKIKGIVEKVNEHEDLLSFWRLVMQKPKLAAVIAIILGILLAHGGVYSIIRLYHFVP